MSTLAVWLYGSRVAVIEQQRNQVRLRYTVDALEAHDLGTPLLSVRFPVQNAPFAHDPTKAFLDGLLPEEPLRASVAAELGLLAGDTFGLIRELGRECAGAVVILPDGEPLASATGTEEPKSIGEGAFLELVANLREAPLGVRSGVRLSLGGVQEKLVLTAGPRGSWRLPTAFMPSTHILKPEPAAYPDLIANEAFCMRFARALGLNVAEVKIGDVFGIRFLIVTRYDRIQRSDGAIDRVHQEDFCQALGIDPKKKYQNRGGPSLRRIASVLAGLAEPGSLDSLVRAVVVNVLIANADAHSKNFSLMHPENGRSGLAPLYDLVSTGAYDLDDRAAMSVGANESISTIGVQDIVDETVSWGMSASIARGIIGATLDGVLAAMEEAAAVIESGSRVFEIVEHNNRRLREEL